MEELEKNVILQLKDCFVELIDDDFEVFHFERFVEETLKIILNIFGVEAVSLYKLEEWKHQFELVGFLQKDVASPPKSIPVTALSNFMNNLVMLQKNNPPSELKDYNFLIKMMKKNEVTGFIAIKDKNSSNINKITDEGLKRIGIEYGFYFGKVQNMLDIILKEKKYKQLYTVTEKFHSSMNMDNLLEEIILSLQEVYPGFSYYLLLSQDNHNRSQLPIRDLEYDNEDVLAMEAYVTGTVKFENSVNLQHSTLYAPLKGKQGVYGVLVVVAPDMLIFPKNEVEFITLLANTAGSALENAQLYHQSRKLIADLQLINETSHCLNSNLRLSETIHYMSNQIMKSFSAQEVGFFLYAANENIDKVLLGSTAFFSTKKAQTYIHYVKEAIEKEQESLFIGDLPLSMQTESLFRSVMAVPMDLGGHLKGIVIVMHQKPYFFSFETFKLLQSLIHHSTLAFTNSMLREELEKMIITDHLTKLHSRNYLDEKINRSMKEDEQGTFILIDIDDFKRVNDTFGHQVGDEVLVQVANLIKGNIRENDVGARWGGEELAIYLPMVSLSAGQAIAKRLVEKVNEHSNPHVTVSCGVSYWEKNHTDTYNYLFKRADEALYVAKGTGKNKVVTQEDSIKVS
jgi:diguanylate cyclase (GGDEF)-like protein